MNKEKDQKYATYTNITTENLSWDALKMILDNSFDEIYVLDHNGKILYVNNVSILHYGILADELIGKSYIYLKENGYCDPPVFPIVMREKKTIVMDQKTKTGKTITVTATPVFNAKGEIQIIVMNSRDISEILRLKQKLEVNIKSREKYKDAMLHHQTENEFFFQSNAMQMCYSLGKRISRFDSSVLILGDSGVGKGVLARYVHNHSKRRDEPFITINCAAIPKDLLESELFGYAKGAFSGANSKGKQGLAAVANHGTLFLDEIGEMPYEIQSKILRLVQDHVFIPLGCTKEVSVDIKLIAATNQNLEKLVNEGTFRKDLYYRLNTIKMEIPPLKERTEDIIPLIQFFQTKFNKKYKTRTIFTNEALKAMEQYEWPGNVRELEHIIERIILINDKELLELSDLPSEIRSSAHPKETILTGDPLHIPTKEEEKRKIIQQYIELKSTYKVAKEMNISQSKVARIIKQHREQENTASR